ncbi:MAG TPA: Clp protease N-terminal domain-containing protein, partial [Chloroflexia bacterium]|nr:Clp protease N-terminal domain-containing protein [Chloroflexia bacterium]
MNLQKYTEKAQEAVLSARQIAEEATHNQFEPTHLLLALVEQPEGVVPQILSRINVERGSFVEALRDELEKLPKVYGGGGQVYVSSPLADTTRRAEALAGQMKDDYVSTEHLLLAMSDDAEK